ncbi:hypothetical protein V6N11_021401 [Hibiscus sabdariffa]|uniref:Uncharacterized protein n=1 Tax=Hibiscus sabdariffa TaxID=183260 RepID=A0ABR1ZY77_9ROSI
MKEDDVGFSRKKTKMLFQIASAAQRSSWRCFSFEEIFIATNAFSSSKEGAFGKSCQGSIVAAVSENLIKVKPDQNGQSVEFMVRAVVTVRNKKHRRFQGDFNEALGCFYQQDWMECCFGTLQHRRRS